MEKEVLMIVVPIAVIFFGTMFGAGLAGIIGRKKTMVIVEAKIVDVTKKDKSIYTLMPKYAWFRLVPEYVPVYEYIFEGKVYRTPYVFKSYLSKNKIEIGKKLEIGINKNNPEMIWREIVYVSTKRKIIEWTCFVLFWGVIIYLAFSLNK